MSVEDGEEKAIECHTRYLEMSNDESSMWADVHRNMAYVHRDRAKGDRGNNMDKSLEHYVAWKAGLSLEDMMPGMVAFTELSVTDEVDSAIIQAAVAKVVAKLHVATKDEDPMAWASNQLELADQCLK
jgi:hypothetical protein